MLRLVRYEIEEIRKFYRVSVYFPFSSASGSAVQWETQRESLEQELPSSAAADNSSVAISSSDQVFTTKTSIDMTLKTDNLLLYYHKKGNSQYFLKTNN